MLTTGDWPRLSVAGPFICPKSINPQNLGGDYEG